MTAATRQRPGVPPRALAEHLPGATDTPKGTSHHKHHSEGQDLARIGRKLARILSAELTLADRITETTTSASANPSHAAVAIYAVFDDPEQILDAIDGGTWRPELFGRFEVAAQAVLDLVHEGRVPWPEVVGERLVASGVPVGAMADLLAPPEALGHRTDGLAYHLARMAEEADRERLRAELVRLGNALETPGGPARVAARLEGARA